MGRGGDAALFCRLNLPGSCDLRFSEGKREGPGEKQLRRPFAGMPPRVPTAPSLAKISLLTSKHAFFRTVAAAVRHLIKPSVGFFKSCGIVVS